MTGILHTARISTVTVILFYVYFIIVYYSVFRGRKDGGSIRRSMDLFHILRDLTHVRGTWTRVHVLYFPPIYMLQLKCL